MHKPLFIGISLPLLTRKSWTLRGMPLLVELEGQLRGVLSSSQEDGGSILRKLLRTPRQFASVLEHVACQLLRMPRPREVPSEEDGR
jgi:hypothetical protein